MAKCFEKISGLPKYFIAVVPSAEAKQQIASFRNPDELHVTIAYLGEKSPTEVDQIKVDLFNIAKGSSQFEVEGSGYSLFNAENKYNGHHPHLDLKTNQTFLSLYDKVKNTLKVNNAYTNFKPHITISNDPKFPLPEMNSNISFSVKSVVLYKVNADGSYSPEASFPLKDDSIINTLIQKFSKTSIGKFFSRFL